MSPKSNAPRLIKFPLTPKRFIMITANNMARGITLATSNPARMCPKNKIKTNEFGAKPVVTDAQFNYDETTYDGYQTIQKSNARDYRQDELDVMREARRKNRMGQTEIDYSKTGIQTMYDN